MCKKENREENEAREIDRYQSIVDRAYKEIIGVRHVYIWLAGVLGLIIIAGITVISLIAWNTIGDMRSDLREEIKIITSRLESEVDLVGRQVTNRIEEEFNKDKIHDTVQTTAKERIDAVADEFIGMKINDMVMPLVNSISKQIEDANNRLTALEDKYKTTIKLAENNLRKQEKITEYLIAFSDAQNGDRKAYDRLATWGEDKTFFLSSQATAAHAKIRSMHSFPLFQEQSLIWKEGIDPAGFTFVELKNFYNTIQISDAKTKTTLITYIWKREDIPKKDRMEFLINIIKNDSNLEAVEFAGRYFNQAANLKYDPLAVDEFVKWWEANKNKIK